MLGGCTLGKVGVELKLTQMLHSTVSEEGMDNGRMVPRLGLAAHSPTEHLHHVVVDVFVEDVASVVLQCVFDGNDDEDHQQRDHGDFLLKGFNYRYPIQ